MAECYLGGALAFVRMQDCAPSLPIGGSTGLRTVSDELPQFQRTAIGSLGWQVLLEERAVIGTDALAMHGAR